MAKAPPITRKPDKVLSRPKGAPMSAATDITNLPKEEQDRISLANAIAGQQLAREKLALDVEGAKNKALGLDKLPSTLPLSSTNQLAPPEVTTTQGEAIIPASQVTVQEAQVKTIAEGAKSKTYAEGTAPSKFAKAFGVNEPQVTLAGTPARIGGIAMNTVAHVYDFVQSLFNSGKGIEQKEAEQTYSRIEGDLASDIALVRQGLKDPTSVKNKIALAETALVRLENSNKGLGKGNLRYWLVNGKDVEAYLANSRDNLNDFKLQLAQAQQIYTAQQVRTTALQQFGQ